MLSSASSAAAAQPEAIIEWLQKEMGYRPLGPNTPSSNKGGSGTLTTDSVRKVCRGNMIPVWKFLLQRVKSEKTVEKIRRNILVHGGGSENDSVRGELGSGRRDERGMLGSEGVETTAESKVLALAERETAKKEVERLRKIVNRQRKELKTKMLELSREEADRNKMLDDRANSRHKQVMLEAYDQQCDEAAKIFAEYHKRLRYYLNPLRTSSISSSVDVASGVHLSSEKDAVYSTIKGTKSAEDIILVETTHERNVREACERLAAHMIDKIRCSFPAYEESGVHLNFQLEVGKLGHDIQGDIPIDVRSTAESCLRTPHYLIQAITMHTQRLKTLVTQELEKVDDTADAEALRYKYENNRITNASESSPSHYQLYGNEKLRSDLPYKGSGSQLLERQKAHVQQFLATEDALNRALEAKSLSQKLLKRVYGGSDVLNSQLLDGAASQSGGSLRQFELEVWAKEREAAGLRASVNTLMSEVQRLNKLCAERKEAENSLRKKWKQIEEFDSRRSQLESIYTVLQSANKAAATFWSQQPLAARDYARSTIIPACTIMTELSNSAKDLIDQEVSAFIRSPDNSLYMLPSTPQALLDSMGNCGSLGSETLVVAERHATSLTARAGSRDPSAIPSIRRVSAALQYPSGFESTDASLASVLGALEFCLKLRGSEACVLEELAKSINLVHVRKDVADSGRALLNHALRTEQEYERATNYCLKLAGKQDRTVKENWLPELRNAAMNSQKGLESCPYVWGLLDEWWEQPASAVVDWVTVDGRTALAWLNYVKKLLALL